MTRMPGCPAAAPWSRHCRPIMLLPLPGPPLSRVTRPAGRPPTNTESNPAMPVATFGSSFLLFCGPPASLACALRFDVATAVHPLFQINLVTVSAGTSATPLVRLFPVILSQAKRKTQFVLGFDQVRTWLAQCPSDRAYCSKERETGFLSQAKPQCVQGLGP